MRYQEWFANKAGFFNAIEEVDPETIYQMFKARMIDEISAALLPNEKIEHNTGYDFIAGEEIKKNDFVYISANGKLYPYRKLEHKTKEEEIIVDGEPIYNMHGLNLYKMQMQEKQDTPNGNDSK